MSAPLTRGDVAALTARLSRLDDPSDNAALLALLRVLYDVGRRDLPLGRLFEGHVDALQIIARYGTEQQRAGVEAAAFDGAAFGVWNADRPGEPTQLRNGRLHGSKAFASGAGVLSHALISVDADGGRQLLLIDLAATPPTIDRTWWRVTGMQRSETHLVSWNDQALPAEAVIGAPGDYVREPWFSGGAIRFAAVQAGGIAAVVNGVRDHLTAQDRAGDPHQRARLAELYLAAQSAADAVARAAAGWSTRDVPRTLALVAAARAAVYAAGERVLALAPAAVGVQAMFIDHPLSGQLTDLSTYLRQPAPDLQRDRLGEAVASALVAPEL
ncbi:hypothetical protein SAMN06297144_3414 [Sphingomonas guangdongensis]|uniref:Acyl-CoA dehydrogenase n=1 Tax=Sphingomonas guangdongensis TaxID=1141890 RepID=A0A285R2C4_9SPHN|nr:acyl-CoA dehydrogenase [Sphingomonas guangdongensis]SOB88266.1 hypothetical protein SAMN06297144_3414 [Sphingomonas guangdongensis]